MFGESKVYVFPRGPDKSQKSSPKISKDVKKMSTDMPKILAQLPLQCSPI